MRNTSRDPTFLISGGDFRSPKRTPNIDNTGKANVLGCGTIFAAVLDLKSSSRVRLAEGLVSICQVVLVLIFTPSSPMW